MPVTTTEPAAASGGLDPGELAVCLKVLAASEALPPDHPDVLAIRRATARVFKQVKRDRRAEKRQAVTAADRAVVAATATGSPQRIDDETEGLPLVSSAPGAIAGVLRAEDAHFIECVRTGVPSPVASVADALEGLRIGEAIIASAASGEVVRL